MKRIKKTITAGAAVVFLLTISAAEGASSLTATKAGEELVNMGAIHADSHVHKVNSNQHILVFYGMGAIGINGTYMQNDGSIKVSTADMFIAESADKNYNYTDFMARGITSGTGSTVINNGSVIMLVDHDPNSDKSIFQHGIYVEENSTVVNNGLIKIIGTGSEGNNVRGITSNADNLRVTNNGTILIDIDNSYMIRGMGTIGQNVVLVNNGLINIHSDSVVMGMAQATNSQLINNGQVIVSTDGIKPTKQYGTLYPFKGVAYGMTSYGMFDTSTVISMINNGYIKAIQPENQQGLKAYAMHISATNAATGGSKAAVGNTGIAEASNGYELGINTQLDFYGTPPNSVPQAQTVTIPVWATTLRDFSGNLFALGTNGTLDFNNTTFILRPSADYISGETYQLSESKMIDLNFNNTISVTSQSVNNFDKITYVSEMPDFIQLNLAGAPGSQTASLTPANNHIAAEKMLSTAAFSTVDFARYGLERLDSAIRYQPVSDDGNWNYYLMPYGGRMSRDFGMDTDVYGMLGGARRQADSRTETGWHVSYNRGDSKNGFYGAAGELHSVTAGFDVKRSLGGGNYLRGEAGGYFGGGSLDYSFVSDYGSKLHGHSDSNARGYYGAVFSGHKDEFSAGRGSRTAEIGLTGMSLNLQPDVKWDIQGGSLPGYTMDIDDSYRSLYTEATLTWEKERSILKGREQIYASLGARYRVAGNELGMSMLGTALPVKVDEDVAALTVEIGYTRDDLSEWTSAVAYRGVFSSNVKNHSLQATLTRWF